MKNKRFDDFTYIFLVNASQMAYIEDAQRTHSMLQSFNELYRYMIREESSSILSDELRALRNYTGIQSSRYENRFSLTLENLLENNDILIKHLGLLDFTDSILSNAIAEYEGFISLHLEIKRNGQIAVNAYLKTGNREETFRITLAEEVK